MDPVSLAVAAASLIATKMAGNLADSASEAITSAVGKIYSAIRARFSSDDQVNEVIDRLEARPESRARAAEVAEILEPRLAADPEFAASLERLVNEAQRNEGSTNIVTTIRDNARVGSVTNIGTVSGQIGSVGRGTSAPDLG